MPHRQNILIHSFCHVTGNPDQQIVIAAQANQTINLKFHSREISAHVSPSPLPALSIVEESKGGDEPMERCGDDRGRGDSVSNGGRSSQIFCRGDVVEIETWCQSEGRIGTRRDWILKTLLTLKSLAVLLD
ncbi:unnamed protein product [Brassica napus]|uniref:(rape) hypothetical protein n=1 Tax=Brassica napus TaxID=3708 RepID=A0A816I6Z7_BRANA|nr:unnamed protein product [Brassica napus]